MRVIVTGSRKWAGKELVFKALNALYMNHGGLTLMHGACSTGADAFAEEWYRLFGRQAGCERIKYKADWEQYGRAAGPIRNREMVLAGADLVLAFPLPGGSGTQHTINLARQAGIEVREFGNE